MSPPSRFLSIAASVLASVALAGQHDPLAYKPPTFPNAENHLKVQFLPPERDWERVDIYVPKEAKEERLPCVVIFYGGGWDGKVMQGKDELQALLDRGYVVAVPDYCLGAVTPVPLAIWDGAHAIRWLRANAAKYRIDPERIGAWGLSAGGWLVQYLAPSDSSTVFALRPKRSKDTIHVPMLDPRPALAEHSARLQAFVSDWGAGRLAEKNISGCPAWLTSDDPPLHTCHVDPAGKLPPGPELLRQAGVPVAIAFLTNVKNTHVPSPVRSLTTDAAGKEITYREHIHRFLDEYVKRRKPAAALGPRPSGVTGSVSPSIITTAERVFRAAKGKPFSARFEAKSALPVQWFVTGKTALVSDRAHNPLKKLPWLEMDAATGVLSGTPDAAGVCPLLVVANARDGERVLCDAVRATVVVEEQR
ncbi:MAG TPA: alpha/beta hydrolase [Planctomycetota bacterium]|nr:alpha/beta hydrolase [Planctomycetota bacterium]